MELTQRAASNDQRRVPVAPWHWQVLAVTTFIGLGLAPDCFAFTTSPTALTFSADQGLNPPSQTLSVYRDDSNQTSLTNSESASWLKVSPGRTSMTSAAQLMVAVNTTGLAAGTYNAMITIKVGKRTKMTVPVTLAVSAPSPPPPPSTPRATLTWDPVMDPTLTGYKVHVGTASGLYTRIIDVGNLASYTVDSLTMGTTYFFVVTAYNDGGESPPSNEVSHSIY